MKHAFVRCDDDGTVCVRWWVDCPAGATARCRFRVQPGQVALGVPYHVWLAHAGTFVDIDELRGAGAGET